MPDKKMYQQYLFKGTLRDCQKRLCGRLRLKWKAPSVYVGQPVVPLQQANDFMKDRNSQRGALRRSPVRRNGAESLLASGLPVAPEHPAKG